MAAQAPSPGPWRVLLVEDSRDDAELIEIALRDAGLDVECHRAWTIAAVREALAAFTPHLVLSDLNLPGFAAADALELVRAHDPHLPFVVLSGLPAEALPEPPGAGDAVLSKDDLDGLPGLARRLLATPAR